MSLVTLLKNLNLNFQYHEKNQLCMGDQNLVFTDWYLLTERKFSLEKSKKEKWPLKLDFICSISRFIEQEKKIFYQSKNFQRNWNPKWIFWQTAFWNLEFNQNNFKKKVDAQSLQISGSFSGSFRSYFF